MAKFREKIQAKKMRSDGSSIGEIARSLHVSKSTVSLWCRDIPLSKDAINKIAKNGKEKSVAGLLKYSESLRTKRKIEARESALRGVKTLGKLSDRDIYCLGLGLYWGEGYKRGSQEFGFTNSDPEMIIFYIQWLSTVFNVSKKDLILRVSINNIHKKRVNEVEKYWSKLTQVPLNQFTKTSLVKTKVTKIYPNCNVHMGTLRIKVRNGTSMRREILGAIKSVNN